MDIGSTDARLRKAFRQMAPDIDATSFYQDLGSRLQASAPRRRSGLRFGVYASVAVVLVAALTVGTIEAVKHLGNTQPTLVIGDEPMVTTETSQLYPVVVDGKLGYINGQGEMIIPPQFEDWPFSQFSEGLAPVSVGVGEKFGYIDMTGAMVIQPRFDGAVPFSDGLAAVVGDNGLWGFIDKTGAVVVPIQYDQCPGPFSEGLCTVMVDERLKGGKLQNEYIDKTGTVVIGPFEWSTSFSEGLAAVGFGEDDAVKWGFIDRTGAVVIQPQFDQVRDFSEGLAAVGFPADNDSAKWGFIDRTGALVIEPRFDGVDPFSEGLAPVVFGENEAARWGYIDKTGTVVIQPQFEWAAEFSEGLAAVGTNSGLFGYIDKTGTFVIPMEREAWAIYPFSGGLARFDPKTGDGSVSPSYLDKTGKVIWQGE
jgi:hypothetical protein